MQRQPTGGHTVELFVLKCQTDIGGCGHEWKAPDPGDTFAECPACHKNAGALV